MKAASTHVRGEIAEVRSEPGVAERSLAKAGEVGRDYLLSRDGGRSEGKSREKESRVEHVDAGGRVDSKSCLAKVEPTRGPGRRSKS